MLEHLHEQKAALAQYATEVEIQMPSANQRVLINKLVSMLRPLEEVTQQVLLETAGISMVRLTVTSLTSQMNEKHDGDEGIQTICE